MKILYIDRLTQSYAICEDEDCNEIEINVSKLPQNIKEGDVIKVFKDDKIIIDKEATLTRKSYIKNLEEDIFI